MSDSEPDNPDDALARLNGLLQNLNDHDALLRSRRESVRKDWATLLPALEEAIRRVSEILERQGYGSLCLNEPREIKDERCENCGIIYYATISVSDRPESDIPVVVGIRPFFGEGNIVYIGGTFRWWEGYELEPTVDANKLTTAIANATRWTFEG